MGTLLQIAVFSTILGLAQAAPAGDSPAPAGKGSPGVLVLENEKTLEGHIEELGGQYCVRRQAGELWVAKDRVLKLCQSREEAYQYLRTRANLQDPDEHIRLARWCNLCGLKHEAMEEIEEAVKLRPEDRESRLLLFKLQQAAADAAENRAKAAPATEEPAPVMPASVTSESLSIYVTKVQPILMNTCASCHAAGRGGNFKLTRVFSNSVVSRRITLQNLSAVLSQLQKDRPAASPLLVKAVSVHGDMAQPALKELSLPFRTLDEWVRLTIKPAMPQGAELASDSAARTPPPATPESTAKAPAQSPPSATGTDARGNDNPAKLTPPMPGDPYDPAVFNRRSRARRPATPN